MRGPEPWPSNHSRPVPGELAPWWTRSRLAAVVVAVTSFATACAAPSFTSRPLTGVTAVPAAGQVIVDPSRTYQVMHGFGASNRVWDDPHVSSSDRTAIPPAVRAELLARLYRDLGLTRVRLTLDGGIEPVNDNDDPFVFDWSKFNFAWKRNDAHVAFVKEAIPFGLETYFPGPLAPEHWMTERDPDEYVEWVLAVLMRWRQLGQEPPFFSVVNEPGSNWQGRLWSGHWMRTVVKRLGARMRAAGLKTELVVPDDVNPTEAYARAREILGDPEARRYVGALAYHLYRQPSTADMRAMQRLSSTYGIPVWMTEFGDVSFREYNGALTWATMIHTLIGEYGVSAVDYMWGFFGNYDPGQALIAVTFDEGRYASYTLTPAYYLTGHFSRFVRPGYVRVDARSADPHVLVTAYTGAGELVIVAINSGHDPKPVTFNLPAGPASGSLTTVVTTRTEPWKTLPSTPVLDGTFDVVLPPESLMTLVGPYKRVP